MSTGAATGNRELHRSRSSRESDIRIPMSASDTSIDDPP
jgi:hypothetical protein